MWREVFHRAGRQGAAAAFLAVVALLGGCADLLPKGRSEIGTPWQSFDDGKRVVESILPFTTRRADLAEMGLDPYKNPSMTLLNYSDILQRFAVGNVLRADELDPGIAACLKGGKRCTGYALAVRKVRTDRTGNFWLDSLRFDRRTETTGWSFNALILLVDDLVVYTLYGGQPNIREQEVSRNPLGPLQGWGDAVPGMIY